jgi:hypothetical protein
MNFRENQLLGEAYALTKKLLVEQDLPLKQKAHQPTIVSSDNKKYILIDLHELEPSLITKDEFNEILNNEEKLGTHKKNGLVTYFSDEMLLLEVNC